MKTSKHYHYSVFTTKWGWFGLLAGENGLVRTCLPMNSKSAAQDILLAGIEGAKTDKKRLLEIENAVVTYYEGHKVDFSSIDVDLEAFTPFQQKVLLELRNIKHGQSITYGDLAAMAGSPKAARAIGACMAKNPIPLIIPCHRVMGATGALTGFSAPGGTETKRRMLQLEGLQNLT
jgi:methylated-DNA-[protein]-cysteine S-methyltransferase